MDKKLYGLMAEFDSATELVDAARAVKDAGYTKTDGFSPFPIHEMDEALGIKRSILPILVFFGGITGLLSGIGLQVFVHYIDYPLNVGGRPFASWPSFIPITFEMMVLCAGVGTVAAFFWSTGLRPGRGSPMSDLRVTDDRFALVLGAAGASADRAAVEGLLSPFHPVTIEERDV